MRQLRSASSSPQSEATDFSKTYNSNRVLRSSSSRSPTNRSPIFPTCKGKITRGHKRSWSSISSDSDSFNGDEFQSEAQKEYARRKAYDRVFGFLTPEASPQTFREHSRSNLVQSATSFLNFPIEIHQHICDYLPTDRDIANYARICSKTSECITSSVWRIRFLRDFDPIEYDTPRNLHTQYIERRRFSQHYVEFDNGDHPLHARCLRMLKDLIIQSDAHMSIDAKGSVQMIDLNHKFIRQFMADTRARRARSRGTNLIDAICNTEALFQNNKSKSSSSPSSLVLIIQMCLLHLSLDPTMCTARAPRFHESQEQVYKCYSEEPIFKGKNKSELNLPWLLHVANFFKFHFKQQGGEGLLSHMYCALSESERPRQWSGKLKGGTQELGKRWKGAFTYLDSGDLAAIRDQENERHDLLVDETNDGNNGFQDLTLFFDIEDHPQLHFGERLEELLHGEPFGPLHDVVTGGTEMPKVIDFFGLGFDGTNYHFNGRVHAMPAQQGIPGFQRVTMMKYLPDLDGTYGFGHTSGWAYEGCVLPGNEIMLGRWWRVEPDPANQEPAYSGPFIFWRVEGNAEDKIKDATACLRFLESISENIV